MNERKSFFFCKQKEAERERGIDRKSKIKRMLFNEYKLEIEEYEEKILNFRALPEF